MMSDSNEVSNAESSLSVDDPSRLLVDVVQQISQTSSQDKLIRLVKSAARQLVGADGATFVLREGENCHYVDEDAIEPLWKGQSFPMRLCVSGWVMQNRQPAIIPNVREDDRIPYEFYRHTFVRSLAMVPIRTISPIGAIGVYWQAINGAQTNAVRWLQSLADSTSLGFEHLRSRSEVQSLHEKTSQLTKNIVSLRRYAADRYRPKLLKMCFVTKQVQIGDEWVCLETYLKEHCAITISHGLSPEGRSQIAGKWQGDSDSIGGQAIG